MSWRLEIGPKMWFKNFLDNKFTFVMMLQRCIQLSTGPTNRCIQFDNSWIDTNTAQIAQIDGTGLNVKANHIRIDATIKIVQRVDDLNCLKMMRVIYWKIPFVYLQNVMCATSSSSNGKLSLRYSAHALIESRAGTEPSDKVNHLLILSSMNYVNKVIDQI